MTLANSENERRAIWAIREDVWQVEEHRAAAHLRREPAIENMKEYVEEVAVRCERFAGDNRSLRVRAHGRRQPAPGRSRPVTTPQRARRSKAWCTGRCGHRRLGFRRAWHRPRKACLSTVVAHAGGDLHHATAQERARSERHSQSRQGVRMSKLPAHLRRPEARRHASRRRSSPAAGTSTPTSPPPKGWCARRRSRARRSSCCQELFETPYFCIEQDSRHLRLATAVEDNRGDPAFRADRARACAWCCRSVSSSGPDNAYFNSIAILDADGSDARALSQGAHPERPGLPGEELLQPRRYRIQGVGHAFRAHRRRHLLGPVVSRDCARAWRCRARSCCSIPTAIGSEPPPALPVNSRDHWQRTQQGHAAANLTPLIVSNRYRRRALAAGSGRAVHRVLRLDRSSPMRPAPKWPRRARTGEAVLTATFDLAALAEQRDNWFVFRDRRPELYGALTTYDGGTHGR